jgi:hypothetical protein
MGITKMAGSTFFRQYHAGIVFAWIHGQNFGRTEFHADAATLAPSGMDDDFTARASFGWG